LAAGFFLVDFDFGLRADRWPEFLTESSDDCAATGNTTINTESIPARQRAAAREKKIGKEAALISSLYSDGTLLRRSRTTYVTAKATPKPLAPPSPTPCLVPRRVVLYTLLLTVLAGNCRPASTFRYDFRNQTP
jgi:hypothetical protein